MTEQPIFRFKFSDDVTLSIIDFAKVHQYDDRKTYKERWTEWCEDNNDMIMRETTRLKNLGYYGDIIDKMFKAGRYYFRKKDFSETKTPRKRRNYITMSSDILTLMDNHINMYMLKRNFTPAGAYDDFCESNENALLEEIKCIFMKDETLSKTDVSNKIKKTYKNRYFMITRLSDKPTKADKTTKEERQ